MRQGPMSEDETGMTQYVCVEECRNLGYKFAGLEVSTCRPTALWFQFFFFTVTQKLIKKENGN